jgi:hypothetical protein
MPPCLATDAKPDESGWKMMQSRVRRIGSAAWLHVSKLAATNLQQVSLWRQVATDDADVDLEIHLARHGICTHNLYLARHCRWNMVGSPPRGIPTMVDWSVEVRVIKNQIVTETQDRRFIQVQAPAWCKTLRPVLYYFILIGYEIWSHV